MCLAQGHNTVTLVGKHEMRELVKNFVYMYVAFLFFNTYKENYESNDYIKVYYNSTPVSLSYKTF